MATPSDPAVREERKVITAVFADLVGSTALAERLDPEDVKLIVGDAVARIVTTVEEFGGTVKDLAGDGVLALFGAPTSHEDDPERAIRAALRIVERIGGYAADVERGWGIDRFGVRVGVSTGPVVLGTVGAGGRVEYAAMGDAVNTAARLQSVAEPGVVLVGSDTKRLVEPLFEWGESRSLELKGKAAPVEAAPVTGATAAQRQARGIGVQSPLVGREPEFEVAREVIAALQAGSGGILTVTGEAGIGKTRLVSEIRDAFVEGHALHGAPQWIEGRCVSYGESLPYWPFRDLLRDRLGLLTEEPEIRVRVALRRDVERLFPDLAGDVYPYLGAMLGISLEPEVQARLAELSPEALQYRIFEEVRALVERLAADGPLVVALEDLHWADPTSIQLAESLLPVAESSPVLIVITSRTEPDHPSWRLKETAAREFPHVYRELTLQALAGQADRELLHGLVGAGTLPEELEVRILTHGEGNPFFIEELVRSIMDAGALVHGDGGEWRFDHDVSIELPPTVEKVILARIDRLGPSSRGVLTAASVLGRQFGLPLLEGIAGNGPLGDTLHELQRLDLVREGRRWPEPEFRFKHALIQEVAYRTIVGEERRSLHRRAAEWLEANHEGNESEVAGVLAQHWLAAEDEDKAIAYLTQAGDRARLEYALDEAIDHYRKLLPLLERRGRRQEAAVVLFKLALALHTSLRFGEANRTYQQAFEYWTRPERYADEPAAVFRLATSFLPNDPDPKSAIAWPNIQLCMQLFDRLVEAWPERTIVPSLAERWEISEDGLRYVFHLRDGLRWSDSEPLTAHDVEFGIKRVLDPTSPGSSVAIYYVLENGQDYALGRNADADRIGVRALDDRTVEFRLVAPAPYFMSVMNRPDSAPQPRHAIEREGDRWMEPDLQIVSGPFRQRVRSGESVVLERQDAYSGIRPGNVGQVEYVWTSVHDAVDPYERDELDMIAVRYTPRVADLVPSFTGEQVLGAAGWTAYIAFDHGNPATSNVDLRRALAHALDRQALAKSLPANLLLATGGLVPPALQGHTPDIAPRFDPDRAREHLRASGVDGGLGLATLDEWEPIVRVAVESWRDVLGLDVPIRTWSVQEAMKLRRPWDVAPMTVTGWLPGYPDPEYYLRLLLHSESKTNEGGFAWPAFDDLIERARQERRDRVRLELFHEADRMAVADRVALIPLAYGRAMAYVKPWIRGWWEFGKSSVAFADLLIDEGSPRTT
jgi:ABC-type oligopeptide transport system substrate-binding subunit/class 3 adenylate cyclase